MTTKHYQQNTDGSVKYSPTGYGLSVFHDVICPKCSYRNPDVSQGMSKCAACGYELLPARSWTGFVNGWPVAFTNAGNDEP